MKLSELIPFLSRESYAVIILPTGTNPAITIYMDMWSSIPESLNASTMNMSIAWIGDRDNILCIAVEE